MKNSANALGSSLLGILMSLWVIFSGNLGMLMSFAILTASHRDLEFPGMILRLTEHDFRDKKWFFISTFKFFMRSRSEFEGLLSKDLKRRFLRLSFLLIEVFGLSERDEQLLRKGSMGMSVSMTDNIACSNLFQKGWTWSASKLKFIFASSPRSLDFE